MKYSIPLKMGARSYEDAVAKLNSLQSNYSTIMEIRKSGNLNRSGLWEMREWTKRMGYSVSDLNQLNVIHITGTKGKGSTAAFTASILNQYRSALPKIGLYTSPHLKSVRERIRINGEPVSKDKFTNYFFEVWEKLEKFGQLEESSKLDKTDVLPKPGYFKYLTLLSFHIFMQEGCNGCVYEVGVGGELDSTNIFEKPVTCGVSLLGIDHTFMLGNKIEEIAWNKGGIFKPGAPAYTISHQPPNGLEVLKNRAVERSTTLIEVPTFKSVSNLKLGINGQFQKDNASLAVALASQFLNTMRIENVESITGDNQTIPPKFVKGLEDTKWEGRCQIINNGNITWYIDGAHTTDSISAASDWYGEIAAKSTNKKILLFNQQTRDAKELVKCCHSKIYPSAKFDEVIFSSNVTWSSGVYSPDLVSMNTSKEQVDNLEVQKSLAKEWSQLDASSNVSVTASIEEALELIQASSKSANVDVFVTGSLHLVGGLLVVFDGIQP